jgi:coenzyme F420-reducing hydrogenase delta subunit/Pyruvate/2-oxoacid:ferredoxin oxidoreductase delta subunit
LTHDRGVFVINPIQTQSADLAATLLAADATAVLMLTLLNQKEIQHQVAVTEVHGELCGGCGACVKTCMFHAVTMSGEPLVSSIDARRCRGCGNCVTACPAGARDLVSCPSSYLSSAVTTLAQFKPAPGEKKMLLMACDGCGYLCLNRASEAGLTWPVSVMPLHVVCGGQIDTQLIMQAFVSGFDAVILAICGEGCCHNLMGNVDLERRVNLLKEVLTSRGVDPARVHIVATCSRNGAACVESVNKYYDGFGAKKAPPAQAQANG